MLIFTLIYFNYTKKLLMENTLTRNKPIISLKLKRIRDSLSFKEITQKYWTKRQSFSYDFAPKAYIFKI